MFYENKKTNEIIEVLLKEPKFIVYVQTGLFHPVGRILFRTNKEFSAEFKKYKKRDLEPLDEELKQFILDEFLRDKAGLKDYTEEYIEARKLEERKLYFDKLSEEEYKESLQKLAD